MSDINHLEYCIKLGNKIIQDKMESKNQINYDSIANTYSMSQNNFETMAGNYNAPKRSPEIISFRERLQNWK